MKKVNAKHFYSFDSATLIKAFNDEEVIKAKLANSGAKDVDIKIETTEDGFKVEIESLMPANAPAAVARFVPEWNKVVQKERWTGTAESGFKCKRSIDIEEVGASVAGSMDMSSQGILTTNIVEMQVSSAMPLVGGQIENFVASSIEKSVAEEFEFLKGHLG